MRRLVLDLWIGLFFNSIVTYIPLHNLRRFCIALVPRVNIRARVFICKGVYIYPSVKYLKIGCNSVINSGCIIDARGGVSIGENVSVSPRVMIFTAAHDLNEATFRSTYGAVHIDEYVVLGSGSIINPGVTVRKGSVVLPGSVVTKDVAEYSIVGGVPAKVVGMRNRNLNYTTAWNPRCM